MSRTPTRFPSPIIALALWALSGHNHNSQAFSSNSKSSCLGAASLPNTARILGRVGGGLPARSASTTISTSTSTSTTLAMSTAATAATVVPTWDDLKERASATPVGKALDKELELRKVGKGAPHVHNKLRLFGDNQSDSDSNSESETKSKDDLPVFTLYRDHAGWCPYCQKTMLLVEAKEIPIKIELVNMRSYGDKDRSFLQKVPNGMLPALEDDRSGGVALDSAYIMEFLETNHPVSEGYKRMVPSPSEQPEHHKRYKQLMTLERELFSWWCTLVFRAESPNPNGGGGGGNKIQAQTVALIMSKITGRDSSTSRSEGASDGDDDDDTYVSPSQRAFLECLGKVDDRLAATDGPYFLDYATDHPTMIDFVFASHIERMLASCAYWKGMDLRNPTDYPQLKNLRNWIDALEKHEYYLAFQSDYYTHVKDIPPQYGPSSAGVSRLSKIKAHQADIDGNGNGVSNSWKLPLADDEALQPLFRGIPLPRRVLEAAGIAPDADGSYTTSGPTHTMKEASQAMAVWKLCGNGPAISKFAARGGPNGAKNVRKTFGAELADPYAKPDESLVKDGSVDACLRVVADAMLGESANAIPSPAHAEALLAAAGSNASGVASSLAYFRDRIGVPRDLPLAAARYLRAYLNWAIDVLESR